MLPAGKVREGFLVTVASGLDLTGRWVWSSRWGWGDGDERAGSGAQAEAENWLGDPPGRPSLRRGLCT